MRDFVAFLKATRLNLASVLAKYPSGYHKELRAKGDDSLLAIDKCIERFEKEIPLQTKKEPADRHVYGGVSPKKFDIESMKIGNKLTIELSPYTRAKHQSLGNSWRNSPIIKRLGYKMSVKRVGKTNFIDIIRVK